MGAVAATTALSCKAPAQHCIVLCLHACADPHALLLLGFPPALQVASSLRIEPMRFATGQALDFTAGDTISEVAVSVLNGGGQRILKTPFTNERLVVTQRLWRLPASSSGGQPAGAGAGVEEEEAAAAGRGAGKRQRKGKKGKGRQDENADPGGNASGGGAPGAADGSNGLPAGAELLLTVENKTPAKEAFQFARISDGLQRSGSYALEFVATPAAPGQAPLRAVVQLEVAPGPACSFNISGEGAAVAAVKDFALGECVGGCLNAGSQQKLLLAWSWLNALVPNSICSAALLCSALLCSALLCSPFHLVACLSFPGAQVRCCRRSR